MLQLQMLELHALALQTPGLSSFTQIPLSLGLTNISPFEFVRAITLVLATFWSIRGAIRIVGFAHNWETKLHGWGMSRRWMRRRIGVVVLRSTVLDPINLALGCVLLALWIGPSRGWFHMDEWRGTWSLASAPAEVEPAASEPTAEPEASAPKPQAASPDSQ